MATGYSLNHTNLRGIPAMEAGSSEQRWSLAEMIGLI
jgi:hypothetical protein